MQKITPHLWYDKEAKEAAELYTSVFPNSRITNVSVIHNTPSGDCEIVSFELLDYKFMSISAGPHFKFNPSVSFHIRCRSVDEVDKCWEKLSRGGKAIMELGEYPWSKRYGWLEDKYGLSWQLIFGGNVNKPVSPVLMFVGNAVGKAEEAVNFYSSVFRNSKGNIVARYGKGEEPNKEGTVKYAQFELEGQEFGAMDSAREHKFTFNEAVSFMVNCDNQKQIDYYWEKLSAVPEAEMCGWLKDKYGLSWQVVPTAMDGMMSKGTKEQIDRITQAFLKMKKFDLAELEKAYNG